ncbi:hypothetical protein HDV03_003344 [Kappamyces sp. JEL0829]|nr:hypothetical protein HDV03_003344 [Kappamyces sp. JEL0829]KAJ3372167.1 hypothetical protein HDU91_004310 [Kappamyces sp. JEL0680]
MAKQPNLHDFFTFGDTLGTGTFATVRLVTETATGKNYAMKVIEKSKSKGMEEQIVKEISILKKMKHNNIVRFVSGGELFEHIVNKGYYGEDDAKHIVNGILEAVQYLHNNGIVHRDLKPENLLMSSNEADAEVKLSDFGLSTMMNSETENLMKTKCGTLMYCAPEILRGEQYTKSVDMWSIGVITYVLLCGYPPFFDQNDTVTLQLILAAKFEFLSPDWDDYTEKAKDFISGLICSDASKRLDCEGALSHSWLSLEIAVKKNVGMRVGTNLTKHFTRRDGGSISRKITLSQ